MTGPVLTDDLWDWWGERLKIDGLRVRRIYSFFAQKRGEAERSRWPFHFEHWIAPCADICGVPRGEVDQIIDLMRAHQPPAALVPSYVAESLIRWRVWR